MAETRDSPSRRCVGGHIGLRRQLRAVRISGQLRWSQSADNLLRLVVCDLVLLTGLSVMVNYVICVHEVKSINHYQNVNQGMSINYMLHAY